MGEYGRITRITKDDETVCSSRVIWVTVKTKTGAIRLAWAREALLARSEEFDLAWKQVKVNSEVEVHDGFFEVI